MSPINAKKGSTSESSATQKATGLFEDPDTLIAQFPDLDQNISSKAPAKPSDGRVISQAVSFKLVFGVGIGLVIGAILPYIFGKVNRPNEPVKALPAWSSNSGPAGTGSSTAQSPAPTWPSPASVPAAANAPKQPSIATGPAILVPQSPRVGDARPSGLSEPAWPQQRSSVAPAIALTPSPAPSNYVGPPPANMNPPDNRGDYRGFDRSTDRQNLQADNRSDPAALYRNNDSQYDYRGNRIENPAPRNDGQNNGNVRDTRYENVSPVYPPSPGQDNRLMPPGAPGPTSIYRDPQNPEPGVARFEGTITTPPVRTSYDRAGSITN